MSRRSSPALRWAGSALAAGAISAAARRKRALTLDGAFAATGVGTVVMARGGWPAAAALVAFFVTSSVLSRFKEGQKARRGVLAQAKGGERDAWQVLANGGVAAACLGLAGRRGTGAFLGALATAAADTWATELGLLARHEPRLLTSLRRVPAGTSGGVTPEGTLAAMAGAATVGTVWAATDRLAGGTPPSVAAGVALVASTGGTLGCFVDSLLGATVQAAYWCTVCGEPVETPVHRRCGRAAARVRGWGWMSNDTVNALATAFGALAGACATWATGSSNVRVAGPYFQG